MLNDLLVSGGVVAIGIGLWMAWPPLSLCVVGATLVAFGVARSLPRKTER